MRQLYHVIRALLHKVQGNQLIHQRRQATYEKLCVECMNWWRIQTKSDETHLV